MSAFFANDIEHSEHTCISYDESVAHRKAARKQQIDDARKRLRNAVDMENKWKTAELEERCDVHAEIDQHFDALQEALCKRRDELIAMAMQGEIYLVFSLIHAETASCDQIGFGPSVARICKVLACYGRVDLVKM